MKLGELLRSVPQKNNSDAVWLLSAILKKSKSQILLDPDYELTKKEEIFFSKAMDRRKKGEPLQYIVKSAPFYGRDFFVDPRVLIPRPETERLVEITLEHLRGLVAPRVMDIGVGSGAIALTLKAELPGAEIYASDISSEALSVAKKNANVLSVNVKFAKADLAPAAWGKMNWDVIVSNPPYLSFQKDKIAADVKKWEPRTALEPKRRAKNMQDRAAWTGERILELSSRVRPKFTIQELSPRVALMLERKWKKHIGVERVWREADLAGRKRFLLVAWKNG